MKRSRMTLDRAGALVQVLADYPEMQALAWILPSSELRAAVVRGLQAMDEEYLQPRAAAARIQKGGPE